MADYSEVHGWPKELYTMKGSAFERKIRCAWSERITVANELDTYPTSIYPYDSSGAILNKILIAPERNSKHSDVGTQGMISYDTAILTCNYSTFGPMTTEMVTETLSPATAGTQWTHEGLYWDAAAAEPLKTNEGPQRLLPKMTYTLHYHRLGQVPNWIYLLGGYTNSNIVFTKILGVSFLPYMLLYRYPVVTRVLTAGGVTAFSVRHTCSYAYNDGLGWNGVWSPEAKAYGKIYNAAGTQIFPYPWTSFSL